MKTAKLVFGIISIALTAVIIFQSCAAGIYDVIGSTGESSGMAGVLVAILMIAGSITMLATRSQGQVGGSVACLVLFLLAALIGFTLAGSYGDLRLWAAWCLIVAALNLVSLIKKKSKEEMSHEK